MTQPAKAQEPSMEEILASIRRIIADDDTTKSPQQAPAPEPPAAAPVMPPRNPAARPALVEPNAFDASPAPPVPEAVPEPAPAPPMNGGGNEPVSDILELTESMTAAEPSEPSPEVDMPPAAQFRTIDGSSDIGFDDAAEKGSSHVIRDPLPQLLSRQTSAAVDSAFNTLAQTVLVQNARTLEDLVREMLRPMLKTWLDENLPGMVERLVRAEIERVARGR
jgi:cell pole-organizing protein PopZ